MHLLLNVALLGLAIAGAQLEGRSDPRALAAQTLRATQVVDGALEDPHAGLEALVQAAEEASELLRGSLLGRTLAGQVQDARWRGLADPRAARERLAGELASVLADLEFEPLVEAELPRGFPALTAVGAIELKRYPAYRMVRANMGRAGSGGVFWRLFTHIRRGGIAMTAPVEMGWSGTGIDAREISMAFLYGSPELGATGSDGPLEVLDVPPLWAVSLGCRGEASAARIVAVRSELARWVASRGDLEVVGDVRTLAYNSPMVPRERRYFEVQLPVQSKPVPLGARVVVDFRDPAEAARWQPVDDRVMGGVSVSRIEGTSVGSSLFTGELSLERNGGFASVRAALPGAAGNAGANAPLAGARELILDLRGDGKAYKLRLRTGAQLDGVHYEARFETEVGVQAERTFAIDDFVPVWRGRPVLDAPPLDPAALRHLGLMIADGQAGRFQLELFTLTAR